MSRETPDELASWRRLLREPDALPGQGLADKDAAWDKLFERLNEKPRRRFFGYRIAAACVLISLIPASRLFHDQPAGGTRVQAEKTRPAILPVATPAPAAANPKTKQAAPAAATTRSAPPVRPMARRGLTPAKSRLAAPPALAAVKATDPVTVIATDPVPAEATPGASTRVPGAPAPKKQWKVVDINELEPGTARPQMVARHQPGLLQLGLKINLTTQNH